MHVVTSMVQLPETPLTVSTVLEPANANLDSLAVLPTCSRLAKNILAWDNSHLVSSIFTMQHKSLLIPLLIAQSLSRKYTRRRPRRIKCRYERDQERYCCHQNAVHEPGRKWNVINGIHFRRQRDEMVMSAGI